MKRLKILLLLIFCLVLGVFGKHTQLPDCPLDGGEKFPDEFVIGAASSAYQIEGAWKEDGKGESIWDKGTHEHADWIPDGSNGDVAADSYHKFMEDIHALKESGFKSYRFSISWARIMPSGEPSTLNQKGLDYYHRLIDALIENDIEPSVTMYHWDLPQAIQDLGGFLNPLIMDYFEDYANVLFHEFGDKVKDWCTFNEPVEICEVGYGRPSNPPFIDGAINGGEYHCAYHLLIAHARAYHLYNTKYRQNQHGKVGIVYSFNFYYPADATISYDEVKRAMQYTVGLYAHPIFTQNGNWPSVVIEQVNENSMDEGRKWSRLPVMSDEMRVFIQGTSDWFGLNYYSSFLVKPDPNATQYTGLAKDKGILAFKDDEWETAESEWLHRVPEGFRDAMNFVKDNYNASDIRITENGWSDAGQLNDVERIEYFKDHLRAVLQVLKCDKVNVTRYYAWSIIDNFEWMAGYTKKFGLYQVDFNDPNCPRTPKDSAKFFNKVNNLRTVPDD